MKFFNGNTHEKQLKMMIFTLKSLILINVVKKIRLEAGALPGVTSSGEHASGGPLRGGYNGAKNSKNIEKSS